LTYPGSACRPGGGEQLQTWGLALRGGSLMAQSIAEEFKSLPMSANLGESLERAHRFAREQSHRLVTLEHLLLALTEDPEASLILHAANVDLSLLSTEVSGYLGRLMEDMRAENGADPRPDTELLRVLQAAASAAQQSKRRQIDGAIVLAAIVGDGKSPAAGQLKALGMTFEEAIRALQRANTQARLKPVAKANAPSPAAARVPDPEPVPVAQAEAHLPAANAQPTNSDADSLMARLPPTSSADEILAAARTRIQQRAAAAASRAEGFDADTPADVEAAPRPTAASDDDLSPGAGEAIEAAIQTPGPSEDVLADVYAAGSAQLPLPVAVETPSVQPHMDQASWTPAPDAPSQPNARLQHPPGARPQTPPPARGTRSPGEGAPRPLSAPQARQRGGSGAPPVLSARPARAPWPDAADRGGMARHPGANGSNVARYPNIGRPAAAPAQTARPAQRPGGQADRGPLVESIPRRMRVHTPATAEVRIAREKIDGLIRALNSRGGGQRPDSFMVRTLCVRLRAPGGGFWIEPASPETQWMEGATSLVHDDYAIWRWTVTPQRPGRGKLLLAVSARTVGADGLIAQSAPPDRPIEVKVKGHPLRDTVRWLGWITALLAAAVLGRVGDEIWSVAYALAKKAITG
jgi:neural Wiskott-Aldrich syndrome protein